MTMANQFRCPHRPWKVPQDRSRDVKAAERRKLYDVPEGTEWTEVAEQYSPGKEKHPRYAKDAPAHWEAEVKCPDCGDKVRINSGTDPGTGKKSSKKQSSSEA
jgi:hypothetical protein